MELNDQHATQPIDDLAHGSVQANHFGNGKNLPPKRGRFRRNCSCCLGTGLALITVLVAAGFVVFYLTKPVRAEAEMFVKSKVVPALQQMDVESIKAIATSEFLKALETTSTISFINGIRYQLGPVKSLDGEPVVQWHFKFNGNATFQRQSAATFEKSTGTVTLIMNYDETWKLHGIRINSDALVLGTGL